jgi:rhamnogalacturonyl hydrolase YesR
MAPPVWAALGNFSGDTRYLDYMHGEYQATIDYLFDAEENLFYRDGRFLERRSPQGSKIFWSRGNGWVYAGLPLLIEQLALDNPRRQTYINLYLQMSASLATLQGDHGYWPVSLLEGQHYPLPETSGTGFIVFGLAWGINQGLLPAEDYQPGVMRGWQALTQAVAADGKLGWVQQVGYGPDQVSAEDTQLYGVGAFLLASSEVLKLAHKPESN